jgi:multiple sugar transport system permease protein
VNNVISGTHRGGLGEWWASWWPVVLFLGPSFGGFVVFNAGPVVASLVMAFTNADLQRPGRTEFVGLENFWELWNDKAFGLYFVNTIYLMLGIPFAVAGSLGLAVLLSQKLRSVLVYRTLLYLPSFTAGVALMLLWKALYNPEYGPINAAIRGIFEAVGRADVGAPMWLGSMLNLMGLPPEQAWPPEWRWFGIGAREAIILMGVWTVVGGNTMLLYLAALGNVPQELYEAAELDGAGLWGRFRNVTWPQLAPTTFFVVVMALIGGLQGGFEQARIMTGGGPAGTTTTLSYYIYTKAFEEFRVGYASAVAWVLFMLIFAFTMVYWRAAEKDLNT